MAECKTGRKIQKGDWLYDHRGIFEVIKVDTGKDNLTHIKEVVFEDYTPKYSLVNDRWLTRAEVARMEIF